ncbi:MAG: flagellar biosynthetic protein FliP, partial [Planctomycetes bacterium]|nr:flagellar biosynthetic protein FliP [Planctomycetota bacterium]
MEATRNGRTDRRNAVHAAWVLAAAVLAALVATEPVAAQPATRIANGLRPETGSQPKSAARPAAAPPALNPPQGLLPQLVGDPEAWTSPGGLTSAMRIVLLLTVLSLAPAVLLMTTCFVRIIVVLGLLRQALGTQQLPPSQVMTSLALFLTLLVMTPVWTDVYRNAIEPYTRSDGAMPIEELWRQGVRPVRAFMSRQIEAVGNSDDIWLFQDYLRPDGPTPSSYDEVPLQVLLPAYVLSELKTAFLIGFQIYLPFLVLDVVIASVTISMG